MIIPVIDIFAGPGGLAEGFSAATGPMKFSVKLSIEKDEIAHQTLQLRSFVRSFETARIPDEYYRYIKGDGVTREQLFSKYPLNAQVASKEAWNIELGPKVSDSVLDRIETSLAGAKHWVLLGGPPCQAYSLVGRARMTGLGIKGRELEKSKDIVGQDSLKKQKLKIFYNDHRHTLYKEYLKIVAVHRPTIFVMENVKGILSSRHGNDFIFKKILSDLKDPWSAIDSDSELKRDKTLKSRRPSKAPRYRLFSFVTGDEPENENVREFIIKAEDYGIPQRRHRVIILGVLDAYDVRPNPIEICADVLTVRNAIGDLPKLRSGLSKENDSAAAWLDSLDDGFSSQAFRKFDKEVADTLKSAIKSGSQLTRGGQYVPGTAKIKRDNFRNWIIDENVQGAIQHETRGHMTSDLWRYLFSASFAKVNGYSPTLEEFPKWLLPNHRNIPRNKREKTGREIHFKDRFKVQLANEPATTITSHISKDGHYYIHYDPTQCRSLTVREAARLQTFPDNYFFEGNRTQQYHQIGNAVPPLLANKLAGVVSGVLQDCLSSGREVASPLNKPKRLRAS